jgi:folate-binding protein YgfZ
MSIAPRETLIVGGRTVALTYEDASREYEALHEQCGVVRRDERARWTFTGAKAAATIGGLVTNDVEALAPGSGCYAAALTAKGKIVADVRIFRRADDFLIDVASRAAAGWDALVRKYVNPRLAKYADVSQDTGCIGAYGPRAATALSRLGAGEVGELQDLAPYHHVTTTIAGVSALIVRSPDYGVLGFDCIVSAADAEPLFNALVDAGARPVGLAAADIARVEAGRPEWGIDMDDTTIPQEANFDDLHAISYTKGCYTGQEVVARLHFRGHVNKYLRRLVAPHALAPRAIVVSDDGKEVGDVRSSVVSPHFGPIAIAMLRRELRDGDEVIVRDGNVEHVATVAPLGQQ